MALTATDIERTRTAMFRAYTQFAWPGQFAKADYRATLTAIDNWIESNQASYIAALPAAARTATTAQQKTILFCLVALRRAGLLKVEEDGQ